jgi:hypothetical protein
MKGRSPSAVYTVEPDRNGISRTITSCSLTAVRWCTSPAGDTKAEKPVGATCTTQRPVSTARSLDEAICWVWRMVQV